MAKHASTITRFYYPVPSPDPHEVLIMCAYEGPGKAAGITFLSEGEEPVAFPQLNAAESYCRWLNAREGTLPAHLPRLALDFLYQGVQKARYLEQQGRRFLVLSLDRVPPSRTR